jgi:hypothetical protein
MKLNEALEAVLGVKTGQRGPRDEPQSSARSSRIIVQIQRDRKKAVERRRLLDRA